MNKVVRVEKDTIEVLNAMHDKFHSDVDSPDYQEFMAFGDIINLALFEYNQHREPSFLREKQRILEKNYVPKEQYNELYDENWKSNEQNKKAMEDLQLEIQQLKKKEDIYKIQLKEQTDTNTDLQRALSDKFSEIAGLKTKHEELAQQKIDLSQSLTVIQNRYSELKTEHNRTQKYLNTECFELACLGTLYHVCRFLLKHKKHWFTVEEICNSQYRIPLHQFENALELQPYNVFPIDKAKTQRGIAYRYNLSYLH